MTKNNFNNFCSFSGSSVCRQGTCSCFCHWLIWRWVIWGLWDQAGSKHCTTDCIQPQRKTHSKGGHSCKIWTPSQTNKVWIKFIIHHQILGFTKKWINSSRVENDNELRQKQEEIASLKSSISKQTKSFNDLKQSMSLALNNVASDGSASRVKKAHHCYNRTNSITNWVWFFQVVAEKISLINQLEEGISDLQASLDEVSRQLADARNEAQQNQRLATTKQKGNYYLSKLFKLVSQKTLLHL